jgi:hypothetical protein
MLDAAGLVIQKGLGGFRLGKSISLAAPDV